MIKGSANKIDMLVHGCNCFNNFGAGIAKEIATKIPNAFKADQSTIFGDKSKLGTYTKFEFDDKTVINMYTQYRYGRGKNVDYKAIENGFTKLNNEYRDSGLVFGIPKIGAGLAGGDWNIIKKIIDDSTPNIDIISYVF